MIYCRKKETVCRVFQFGVDRNPDWFMALPSLQVRGTSGSFKYVGQQRVRFQISDYIVDSQPFAQVIEATQFPTLYEEVKQEWVRK